MRSFWRVLLVWLTVLAMPIQGYAAARLTHCLALPVPVSGHQHEHERGHQDQHGHQHGAHEARAGLDHLHVQGHHGHADAGSAQASADTSPRDGQAAGADMKCSACAACCTAVALAGRIAQVPILDLASTPTAPVAIKAASFIASGPERPPRPHLA